MGEEKTEQKNDNPPRQPQPPLQIPELSDIDMLSGRIAELENSVNQYKDQLLRKAAEFENYKKRVENDYAAIVRFSNEDLLLKLLPVLDDFERSLKMSGGGAESSDNPAVRTVEPGQGDSFRRGVELIYNKLRKVLEAQGVRPFEVVGQPFDPHLHDALLQVPRNDVPPHTVVEEVDKGYMLNDKVLRHAKVIVAADFSSGKESAEGAGESDWGGAT